MYPILESAMSVRRLPDVVQALWTLEQRWVDVVQALRFYWKSIRLLVSGFFCSLVIVVLVDVTIYKSRRIYRSGKALTNLHRGL